MEKIFWATVLLAITACHCQPQYNGPNNPRQQPFPVLLEREDDSDIEYYDDPNSLNKNYNRGPPQEVPNYNVGPQDPYQVDDDRYVPNLYPQDQDRTQTRPRAPPSGSYASRGKIPNLVTEGDDGGFFYHGGGNCKPVTFPDDNYCDVYKYRTTCDEREVTRSCPNGLIYTGNGRRGLVGVCDYPHRADCGGKEKYNPPISTEHCDWLYGIFGHETSCTRYWTCWNGTATEQFCIGGLLYNEETHACDWPQNVGGCQKHPLCKDDPNGNVPLGKSCNRYWACQGGYPRLQRCPAMLVFEKTRKRCVSPPTADCDVPPTEAPTDDEDGREDDDGIPRRGQQGQGQGGRPRGPGGDRRQPPPPNFELPEGARPLN